MNDEDILQACVDEVLAGNKTPDECVAHYPQFPGLRAYLQAAVVLRATQSLRLAPEIEHRIEARLRQQASELATAQAPAAPTGRRPVSLRWVAAPALIVTLLLAGIGTTSAAGNSNPGDLLYGLKRANESAQIFLSQPAARASVYVGLARHRLDEMTVVVQRRNQDAGILNKLSDDLTEQTSTALAFVDDAPADRQADILNTLVQMTDAEQSVLASVQRVAPPEAQAGLQRALQASGAGHARAVERLQQLLTSQEPKQSPASGTPTATSSATPTATQTGASPKDTVSPEPSATATPSRPGEGSHVPPGQTHIPPGQTRVPPGQTHVPPGQTRVPPGQTKIPPGQVKTPKPTKPAGEHGL